MRRRLSPAVLQYALPSLLLATLVTGAVSARAQSPLASTDAATARTRAKETVVAPPAQDAELVLESELWRNFQPSTAPRDTRLTALLRLRTADRRPLPSGVRIERAWLACADVRCEGERWSTVPARSGEPDGPDVVEAVARGGPSWHSGAAVDVIVEVRDAGGNARRLAVRAQRIRRLD
jgi:hypothetical protein